MAKVSELGYLGVGTGDLAAWQKLATDVFGMQILSGDSVSTSYLRIDHHHHRIELNAERPEDLQFVGWEVPDAASLDAIATQLENGGVDVKAGTRDDAAQRRVVDCIKCVDPSGISTEIFYGHPVNPNLTNPAGLAAASRRLAKAWATSSSTRTILTPASASTVTSLVSA